MEKMRVLVTGATGFIGSYLVEKLIGNRHEVLILKRSTSNIWRIKSIFKDLISYDIDKVTLKSIFDREKIDVIIHLATNYKKFHKSEDVENMIDTNIKFPTILLELARTNNVKYFINTGTFFEYDFVESSLKENSPKTPFDLYASTKLAFEELLKFYAVNYNLKAITLKLFAPYGGKDHKDKLIPYIILNALKDNEILLSHAEQRWDFTYVKDVVDAFVKAMDYVQKMNIPYDAFNIGRGEVHSIKEVVETVETILGKKIKVRYGAIPYSDKEIFYARSDPSKSFNKLQWLPRYDLYNGLKETIDWFRRNKNDF